MTNLPVKYWSQRDNYRDANRTCFASSCAMALGYLKPEAIKNDDDYVRTVFSLGDTTQAWVQVKALAEYGISSRFVQNMTNDKMKSYIDSGIPVPCGILHKGPAHRPNGGGHWIIVTGYVDDQNYPGGGYWIVNDPWGQIDHASGTYPTTDGEQLRYSFDLMNSRWTVDSSNDGWSIIIDKKHARPTQKTPEAPETAPKKKLISKTTLAFIWECNPKLIYDFEIEEMNKCLERYEINTGPRLRHFLSQTAHESGGGRYKKEISNGKYLEGRKDIGNIYPGDGPKYKGAGYIQLTGRANYQYLSDYLDDPRVMEGVDYVAKNYPFTSAGYWWMRNDMNRRCDEGYSVKEITRVVNGGYNGLADREKYYKRCTWVIAD